MTNQGFLYRRLARFLPCVFPHVGRGSLSVRSKYDIASVRDVFLSAHYWRVFDHMTSAPELVVDLGAHCGHFSVLCHLAILERFGADSSNYILVEAMSSLIPRMQSVMDEVGFDRGNRVQIVHGLIGKKTGVAHFQTDPRNLLSSKASAEANPTSAQLGYTDLDSILPGGTKIDVLKIDIEGSEYDLVENYPHVLKAARLVLVEVHGGSDEQVRFEGRLEELGLSALSPAIVKEHERLILYGNAAATD